MLLLSLPFGVCLGGDGEGGDAREGEGGGNRGVMIVVTVRRHTRNFCCSFERLLIYKKVQIATFFLQL